MLKRLSAILIVLFVAGSIPVHAADFPTKEVQVIIPWAAGGATDLIFRALGATAGKYLNKAVVVVNRPGGGGAVGYTDGMKAKPDGYILTAAVTPLCILPHQTTTAFTYKDFEPILNVVSDPSMFLVRSDAPWKDLREFVDYAKKNPDMITVGNSGAGGGVHLVALAFENAAGIKLNHIPFSGGGPSVTALLGGHVNAVSVTPPEGVAQIKAGQATGNVPGCGDGQGAGYQLHDGDVAGAHRAEGHAAGCDPETERKFQESHGRPRIPGQGERDVGHPFLPRTEGLRRVDGQG
jgi:tripartite-type tricarboxylate transporter receptor subunit TctC